MGFLRPLRNSGSLISLKGLKQLALVPTKKPQDPNFSVKVAGSDKAYKSE